MTNGIWPRHESEGDKLIKPTPSNQTLQTWLIIKVKERTVNNEDNLDRVNS